jgi:tetratricopeptide (TPR) repeat protein
VIPRGLALFPNSAELLAVQARDLRTVGKLPESLELTRRAMAMDSSLKRGHLVIAQLELDLGHPDSALASLRRAAQVDPDTATIAQFALSSGNAFYRNANTTQSPGDYRLAYRFLAFSDTVRTSPQARFLTGAAALGVARTSLSDATQRTDKSESCRIARSGAELLPAARSGLSSGIESYADMAKQSLEYLDKLGPYYEDRLKSFCGSTTSP